MARVAKICLSRLLSALALICALASPLFADTLLPPGSMQFFDNNGLPLSGGQVFFYIPNTTTPKSTYQNATGSVLNPNPVILDSSGRAIIYGSGCYQEKVEDLNGNLIWNQQTCDTSSSSYSWAATSGGSANAQTLTDATFSSVDGQVVGFIAGFTNTSALTLNVNGAGPIAVVKGTASGPVALTGGEVVASNQYQVTYSATNGNFQLTSFPAASTLPITAITGWGTNVLAAAQQPLNSASGLLQYQDPQVTVYAAHGTGTYTTPAGATYLEIEMIGAGGGGAGSGTGTTAGAAGTATTFGSALLTANAGAATSNASSSTYATAATATGGDDNISGALGGWGISVSSTANNGGGGAASFYGAGGPGGSANGGQTAAGAAISPGAGGGGAAASVGGGGTYSGWGGNAGAFLRKLITSPLSSYAYQVGTGGVAGSAGSGGSVGAAGADGRIKIIARFQ